MPLLLLVEVLGSAWPPAVEVEVVLLLERFCCEVAASAQTVGVFVIARSQPCGWCQQFGDAPRHVPARVSCAVRVGWLLGHGVVNQQQYSAKHGSGPHVRRSPCTPTPLLTPAASTLKRVASCC